MGHRYPVTASFQPILSRGQAASCLHCEGLWSLAQWFRPLFLLNLTLELAEALGSYGSHWKTLWWSAWVVCPSREPPSSSCWTSIAQINFSYRPFYRPRRGGPSVARGIGERLSWWSLIRRLVCRHWRKGSWVCRTSRKAPAWACFYSSSPSETTSTYHQSAMLWRANTRTLQSYHSIKYSWTSVRLAWRVQTQSIRSI